MRIIEVKCRTDRYFKSFFPSTIREWNNLSNDMCNVCIELVKTKLFELWRTQTNIRSASCEYITACGRGLGKLLTQFRVGLSPLKYHLFEFHIIDNPFCASCGQLVETIKHFFIDCPCYTVYRNILMQDLFDIFFNGGFTETVVEITTEDILSRVMYGFSLSETSNEQIRIINYKLFTVVRRFITSTKRFSLDYYYFD